MSETEVLKKLEQSKYLVFYNEAPTILVCPKLHDSRDKQHFQEIAEAMIVEKEVYG